MKKGKAAVSNQMQARYLKTRMEAAGRIHNSAIYEIGKVAKPAKVIAAERIVKDYNTRVAQAQHALRERLRKKMQAESAAVYQTILFCAPQEALAAVEAFERRTFG